MDTVLPDTILRSKFWSEGVRSKVKALFDSHLHSLPTSIPWPEGSWVSGSKVMLPHGAVLEFRVVMPTAPVRWSPILHKDGTVEAIATYCVYFRSMGNVPPADLREIGRLAETLAPFLPLTDVSDAGSQRYGLHGSKWGTPRELERFLKTYFAS